MAAPVSRKEFGGERKEAPKPVANAADLKAAKSALDVVAKQRQRKVSDAEANKDVFEALISPRGEDPSPFIVLNQVAFNLIHEVMGLLSPLIRSHDGDEASRNHRLKIVVEKEKANYFVDHLFQIHDYGPRQFHNKDKHTSLCIKYIQRLYVICKAFKEEHKKIHLPTFPTSQKNKTMKEQREEYLKLIRKFQNDYRHAQNERDALILTCIADIVSLGQNHKAETTAIVRLALRPRSDTNVLSAVRGFLSPRSKKD